MTLALNIGRDEILGVFTMFVLIVITFYSGELVWRERDAGRGQIHDATPAPRLIGPLSDPGTGFQRFFHSKSSAPRLMHSSSV